MTGHYQWRGDVLWLHCQLQPRASKDEIVGLQGERLKIRITAPPVDGKANQHLVTVMAKWFGVSKRAVTILRGETGRQKTLAIEAPAKLPEAAEIRPGN